MALQPQPQYLNNEFDKLNMKEDTKSNLKLEIDNAYLQQQNEHLNKELSFARYTINALKGIANQRDMALNDTRLELDKALQHIQLLSYTLKQQQHRYSLSGIGLVQDADLSDDLSEEDDFEQQQQQPRRPLDIMSKLPLRQPPMTDDIFMSDRHIVNDSIF